MGPTTKHRWAYACSKALDEFLALAYCKERKLPVIVVRLFNTVGPRQTGRYGMVIPNVRPAGAGRAADHGVRRRHADALLHPRRRRRRRAHGRWWTSRGRSAKCSTSATSEEISILGLAERVRELTGESLVHRHVPYDEAYEAGFEDMPRRVPGPRRRSARSIGYRAQAVDLDDDPRARRRGLPEARKSQCFDSLAGAPRESGTEAALRRNAKSVRQRAARRPAATARRWPEIVQIESTNICNAKCVFCPRDDMERRRAIMDMDLFKKIVDECVELGITHVRVHNYGEPFLDRQLVEKVRYAKQRGIPQVGMISNGSLITEAAARGMIDAGLDAINISVDASGKEIFERTRVRPEVRQGDRQRRAPAGAARRRPGQAAARS